MLSWAIVEPSVNSTIEWTTDCGWTTTSIWSYGVPNSSWASITSRPLFISVLESTVIFGPMLHVGWASAASTVTSASSAADRPRNGPPLAVSTSRATSRPASADERRHWCSAQCSLSTGTSSAPGVRPQRLHDRPGGDQALLVGQRQPLAGPQRLDRDRQAGEPDDAVDHHVGRTDQLGQIGDHLDRRAARRRRSRRASGSVDDDERRAGTPAPVRSPRRRRPADAERDDLVRPGSRAFSARMTSSVWVPIEPVDPAMPTFDAARSAAAAHGSTTSIR